MLKICPNTAEGQLGANQYKRCKRRKNQAIGLSIISDDGRNVPKGKLIDFG
jgi:hypothetical protein